MLPFKELVGFQSRRVTIEQQQALSFISLLFFQCYEIINIHVILTKASPASSGLESLWWPWGGDFWLVWWKCMCVVYVTIYYDIYDLWYIYIYIICIYIYIYIIYIYIHIHIHIYIYISIILFKCFVYNTPQIRWLVIIFCLLWS